jgi:DNA-binding protein H-NS
MKLDLLDDLKDDELQAAIQYANGLLKSRDEERKAKAIADARTLLASVGLSLKDLGPKGRGKPRHAYLSGHQYQHPTNKTLTWNGKGKKPGWLTAVEADGGRAVEITEAR